MGIRLCRTVSLAQLPLGLAVAFQCRLASSPIVEVNTAMVTHPRRGIRIFAEPQEGPFQNPVQNLLAFLDAILSGSLRNAEYDHDIVFGLAMPTAVPGVPSGLLNPRNSWSDTDAYDATAHKLASMFVANFEKFADEASAEVIAAAPNPNAAHAS